MDLTMAAVRRNGIADLTGVETRRRSRNCTQIVGDRNNGHQHTRRPWQLPGRLALEGKECETYSPPWWEFCALEGAPLLP
jgi:hypothetical protein